MSGDSVAGKLKIMKTAISRRGSSLNATLEAKDVRLQLDEAFERDNGYSFDYVLVFQVHDEAAELSQEQKDMSMRTILQHLARGGIETKMFYSADRGHVFCKLRATLERLGKEADRIDYKVEFDPAEIRKIAEVGYHKENIKPIHIEDEHRVSHRDPFESIFAKYDVEPRLQPAYRKYGSKQIPFRGLLLNIIKTHGEGGCWLNLSELLKNKCLVAAFPLHERQELEKLRSKWFSWRFAPWSQPLVDIKDYFGEKVGLYFAWLALLDRNMGRSFYYEYWKRYNSTLALEWGMTTFEEEEIERPEFQGKDSVSPVDGSRIRYFNPQARFRRVMGSLVRSQAVALREDEERKDPCADEMFALLVHLRQLFIGVLIVLVIGVVAGIFVFRYAATSGKWKDFFTVDGVQLGGAAASTVNAVQIMVMNSIYSTVAEELNRFENHRTDTEYEDHLIGKTFLFQFVNSYASLFYVAFIKTTVEGDTCRPLGHGCMDELMMGLGIIFVLRLTSGNFFEVGLPWIKQKLRKRSAGADGDAAKMRREPSRIEEQLGLDVYDQKGTFDDYNEMIIQFGYVTLFVVAFPLAPVMALFNNFFEIRIDAHKLVNATRRPDPRGAQDIGTWGTIIDLMGSIAMVTNVALVCFTSRRTTAHLSEHERLWLFVSVEHALILLKYVLMIIVDDEPHDVTLQKQRANFIVDKLVNLIADDDDEELSKGNQVRVDLTVFDEDI
ncbi:hypothetical protein BBJ28_00011248 [Nothophytophthora sp. Chile5]|nr:hypothetical protein BBJ28_00011248 [Nothophytophthora sp. Chile5]